MGRRLRLFQHGFHTNQRQRRLGSRALMVQICGPELHPARATSVARTLWNFQPAATTARSHTTSV